MFSKRSMILFLKHRFSFIQTLLRIEIHVRGNLFSVGRNQSYYPYFITNKINANWFTYLLNEFIKKSTIHLHHRNVASFNLQTNLSTSAAHASFPIRAYPEKNIRPAVEVYNLICRFFSSCHPRPSLRYHSPLHTRVYPRVTHRKTRFSQDVFVNAILAFPSNFVSSSSTKRSFFFFFGFDSAHTGTAAISRQETKRNGRETFCAHFSRQMLRVFLMYAVLRHACGEKIRRSCRSD